MLKNTVLLTLIFLLTGCATLKQVPPQARGYKQPHFFSGDTKEVAFKINAFIDSSQLTGVLRIKKVGPQKYDVLAIGDGAYKLMQALVTPEGIAWRFMQKEADSSTARSRIGQFLNLLLLDPVSFKSMKEKKDHTLLTYQGVAATWRYAYAKEAVWPSWATTSTLLNSARMVYEEYTPYGVEGEQIPHRLFYEDGPLAAELILIRIK